MTPTIETIPLMQLASGDRLSLQVYKFVGAQPGKKVYLQANLHGDEVVGNAVIHELIEFLMTLDDGQLRGEIWLLPVCNPLGVNQRNHHFSTGRFNAYDGKNWNRIFWDYEKTDDDVMAFARSQFALDLDTIQHNYRQRIRAAFVKLADELQAVRGVPFTEKYRYHLQSLCLDADYLIDLHSSSDRGLDYVYYFRDRDASAKFFLLDAAVLLDEYDGDAFDESFIKPWLSLETCFDKLGRSLHFDIEAWTLELGTGMQLQPESVAKGVLGIQNYLTQKGVLAIDLSPTPLHTAHFTTRSKMLRYCAPAGGMIRSRVALGSRIEAGQCLYQILSFNKEGKLPSLIDVQAEQPGLVFDVSTNQAVNEGEYVLGILLDEK